MSWMSYSVGQQPLELRAVEAGRAADQRHAGRIEVELVLAHRLDDVAPGRAGREEVHEAGLAELGRDHLVGAEHLEVLRDQRMARSPRARILSAIAIAFITRP